MDPIKGIDQITQLLRKKLDKSKSSISKTGPDSSAGLQSGPAKKAAQNDVEEVKRRISERIRTLPDEDRRGPKAARIFVEQVVTWEFGEQLLQDPQLAELTGEVVHTIAGNPALWKKMEVMLSDLGRGK